MTKRFAGNLKAIIAQREEIGVGLREIVKEKLAQIHADLQSEDRLWVVRSDSVLTPRRLAVPSYVIPFRHSTTPRATRRFGFP